MHGAIRPDHAKYAGCDEDAGTIQLGITTANAKAVSTKLSRSLPVKQSLFAVLAVISSDPLAQARRAIGFRFETEAGSGRCLKPDGPPARLLALCLDVAPSAFSFSTILSSQD